MTLQETFIQKIREDFPKKKVVVLGDLMVDEYVTGSVSRISPEAPVCVLNYAERARTAGGASNVAMNLKSLGAAVSVLGVAGDDSKGTWLRNYLDSCGIDPSGIVSEQGRPTTVKTRFATKGQQLLRVDREDSSCVAASTQLELLDLLEKSLDGCSALVLSDYNKGVLAEGGFVRKIVSACRDKGVLCCIDSKSKNIENFAGMDFVKPNNLELEAAVGIKINTEEDLDRAGEEYLRRSAARALVVTRGAKGISIFVPGQKRVDFASCPLQVFDVTGAGDTVISAISLALACGLSLSEAAQLANLAASVAISKIGTVPVTSDELLKRTQNEVGLQ